MVQSIDGGTWDVIVRLLKQGKLPTDGIYIFSGKHVKNPRGPLSLYNEAPCSKLQGIIKLRSLGYIQQTKQI